MGLLDRLFSRGGTKDAVGAEAKAAEEAKNRGNEFLAKGELDRAAACYDEAIRIQPSYAEAYVNLAHVRLEQKRYDETERLLLAAVGMKPALWQAHLNLGRLAEATKRLEEAEAYYRHVIAMRPSYTDGCPWPEAHWRLAEVLLAQERHADAMALVEAMLAFNSRWASARCFLGTVLNRLGRNDEAIAQYERVLADEPDNADATYFIGAIHEQMGRFQEAGDYYARASTLNPPNHDAQACQALLSLLLGDYEVGWAQHRKMLPNLQGKDRTIPTDAQLLRKTFTPERYWDGDELQGGTLLIWTEQGLGDTLMMLRYLPLMKARGAGRIVFHCEKALIRIVGRLEEVDEVVIKPGPVDGLRFDRHCSTMSLPSLHGTRLDTIPSRVPYIAIPADEKEKWAARLSGLSGFKVGFAWGGNPVLAKDRLRSIPLNKFASLFEVQGVSWFSLQKGEPAAQLKEGAWPIIDWMAECSDMQETGALMEALDLVICVDTSVVHLAGALGRPAWLLNRFSSEWRWLLERDDSPWYPSVKIFRQPALNDWDSVIARMAAELARLAGR